MKRILCRILFAVFLLGMLSGCVEIREHMETQVIGVVAKGDDTAFWRAVMIGAEDAARDHDYAITFRGTQEQGPLSVRAQRDIFRLALDNGVKGIVFAAVDDGFGDLLKEAKEKGIPVVQFDSGILPSELERLKKEKMSPVVSTVTTDNYESGRIAAEKLYLRIWRNMAASPEPFSVGVIQHDRTLSGTERTRGFQDRFSELAEMNPDTRGKSRILVESCTGGQDLSYAAALQRLQKKGLDALFMTSGDVVDQVYDQIQKNRESYRNVIFTGFDAGDKQLAWLRSKELPVLIGSITQDAYGIGYHAVTECIHALEAGGVKAFVNLEPLWYDTKNLDEMSRRNMIEEG